MTNSHKFYRIFETYIISDIYSIPGGFLSLVAGKHPTNKKFNPDIPFVNTKSKLPSSALKGGLYD